jgi:hypothetical protein
MRSPFQIGLLSLGVLSAGLADVASAQELHLIPGVEEISSDSIPDIAVAAVDDSHPVIYYNPRMARRYGPQLTEFFLAHEYGHIALKHTRSGLSELPDAARDSALRAQELEADCYAAGRAEPSGRVASEAAIRFFTRLGPFRFDQVHPTGSQRAAQILACLPVPREEVRVGLGETGVEMGPVSGEVQRITFRVSMASLTETERGREARLWVDGLEVGNLSNMRIPWSIAVDRFGAGMHNYRMELDLFDQEGNQQYSRSGTVVGQGQIVVREGDAFMVQWTPGSAPSLVSTTAQ